MWKSHLAYGFAGAKKWIQGPGFHLFLYCGIEQTLWKITSVLLKSRNKMVWSLLPLWHVISCVQLDSHNNVLTGLRISSEELTYSLDFWATIKTALNFVKLLQSLFPVSNRGRHQLKAEKQRLVKLQTIFFLKTLLPDKQQHLPGWHLQFL